ncbi:MAG: hypothetical protein AB1505_27670 [Candidatus Latescibacterota bacterium]
MILPDGEHIRSYRSGFTAQVVRQVSVWALSQDLRGRQGIEVIQDLADAALAILRGVPTLPDADGVATVKLPVFQAIDYHNRQPLDARDVYAARLRIEYESNEQLPRPLLVSGQVDNPRAATMVETLRAHLESKLPTTLSDVPYLITLDSPVDTARDSALDGDYPFGAVAIIVDDVGTVLALDTGVDLSAASQVQILYRKPSGTTGAWVGEASSTKAVDTTQEGDIDEVGTWSGWRPCWPTAVWCTGAAGWGALRRAPQQAGAAEGCAGAGRASAGRAQRLRGSGA